MSVEIAVYLTIKFLYCLVINLQWK